MPTIILQKPPSLPGSSFTVRDLSEVETFSLTRALNNPPPGYIAYVKVNEYK